MQAETPHFSLNSEVSAERFRATEMLPLMNFIRRDGRIGR